MLKTIKTVLYTLMSVFIIATIAGVLYAYGESKEQKAEIETQEIVDTLEKILVVTKPDFERANNRYENDDDIFISKRNRKVQSNTTFPRRCRGWFVWWY